MEYNYQKRCIISIIDENKILSEKIKSFDIIPTKDQLFDIAERIDFAIKEIKCEVNILQKMNFGNENVKNALKNKMLEFYNNFCMNCLKQVNHDSTKSKIVKCKCPQLHKLLDTNKFDHRVCKDCYKNYTGNCKICNIYHSRLVN